MYLIFVVVLNIKVWVNFKLPIHNSYNQWSYNNNIVMKCRPIDLNYCNLCSGAIRQDSFSLDAVCFCSVSPIPFANPNQMKPHRRQWTHTLARRCYKCRIGLTLPQIATGMEIRITNLRRINYVCKIQTRAPCRFIYRETQLTRNTRFTGAK